MSHFEKIASVFVAVLVVCTVIFSYHEVTEPHTSGNRALSGFDQSLGQNFTINAFATTATSSVSGGIEDSCSFLQLVVIAALHDIKEHLEAQDRQVTPGLPEEPFEVNPATLELLCNKNAEITLTDASGNTLVLTKLPFKRVTTGSQEDIGTEVRINATIIPQGAPTPAQPTTYGDVLIPDRFLDGPEQ